MEKDITRNKMSPRMLSHPSTAEDGQPEVERAEVDSPNVPTDMNAWLDFESRYCTTPPPGAEAWIATQRVERQDTESNMPPVRKFKVMEWMMNENSFDASQARRHLEALFSNKPPSEYFIVFALPSLESRSYQSIDATIDDPWLKRIAKTENLYVSMGTRREQPMGRERGDSEGVDSICCLWCELDARGSKKREEDDSCLSVEDCERIARELDPPPSFIVRSGHGVHCYWLLDAPLAITEENREEVKDVLRRFQKVYLEKQLKGQDHAD